MFDPSLADVRRFFCEVWRKHGERAPLAPLEAVALDWILKHPEYQAELADPESAVAADYSPARGRTNPFLHLSLHLAIAEQLSIDQPPGMRACMRALERRFGDAHQAAHQAQECLAETLWQSQRDGGPPDQDAYLACLRRRAGLAPDDLGAG